MRGLTANTGVTGGDVMAGDWYSRERAVDILRANGVPDYKVWHDLALAEVARQVAGRVEESGQKVDGAIIDAGCVLHDLGVCVTRDDLSPSHAAHGARIIRECGYPEAVARCVECHELAGIDDLSEATDLGIEDMARPSYRIATWEERIVTWADAFIGITAECMLDPWSDPHALVKIAYPYVRTVVMRWSGKVAGIEHPAFRRLQRLQDQMMPYTDRAILADGATTIAIKTMHSVQRAWGLKLPFPYAKDLIVEFGD
jgi:putative nucleotidyltransferase with HDIG domain